MSYVDNLPQNTVDKLNTFFTGYRAPSRPVFDRICTIIGDMDPDTKTIVHTLYVIFVEPTSDQVFASIHFVSRHMYLGLALPESIQHERLLSGDLLRYKGLTKAIMLDKHEDVDTEVAGWLRQAFRTSKDT